MTLNASDGGAAKAPAHSAAYRIYVLMVLLAVYIVSYIDRTLVGVLAPAIKADLQLTDSQLGLLGGTAFALAFLAFSMPFGWLTDRLNRTWMITCAVTVWSGFVALFGLAQSFSVLLLSRVGLGAGEAGSGPAAHSLLIDYFPRSQRSRVMSVYGFGVPLGVALGAAFGGWATDVAGWRATFLIAAGIGVFMAILMKLTVREPSRIPTGAQLADPEPFAKSLKLMASKPAFVALCMGVSLAAVVGFSYYFWVPSYFVRSFGLSLTEVSYTFGLIQLVAGLSGSWVGGFLSDHFTKRDLRAPPWVAGAGYIVATPFFIGFLTVNSANTAFALLFIATFFNSFQNGPLVAATQHLATARLRGTAASMLNFVLIGFAMALGVPMVGALSDFLTPRFGAEALRYSLLAVPIFYVLGAACHAFAGWRLIRDGAPVHQDTDQLARQS